MKRKRWETEEQILNAIDSCRSKQLRYQQLGEHHRLNGLFDDAEKSEKKACRVDVRVHTLKEKLAAFRTQLLPMDGNTDKAVV